MWPFIFGLFKKSRGDRAKLYTVYGHKCMFAFGGMEAAEAVSYFIPV